MFWTIFGVVQFVWIVFLLGWIVLERRSPTAALAWIFGLAFLPVVGYFVYFFVGPRRLRRLHFRRAVARKAVSSWTGGRQFKEHDVPVPASVGGRAVADVAVRAGESPPLATESVHLFNDGDECFEAILAAIRSARHHVHLEYYIMSAGTWASRLSKELAARARDGVQVRLLLDAHGSNSVGGSIVSPLVDAGVEVSFFNTLRFNRLKPRLANFRTHRKIVIVDGEIGFTGGMNITDVHSRTESPGVAWRDCHIRFSGDAVLPLALVFLEDWHYARGSAPQGDEFVRRPRGAGDGPLVQVVASGPDQDSRPIARVYFAALGSATRRAYLTTPYFVPDEATLAAFTGAALRGVDVRLLVPRKTDEPIVRAAQMTYYEDLLRAGVRVYEYLPGMIHAKTLTVDDDLAIVGTANLDNRSFRLNFEVIAVIYGPDVAKRLAAQYEADLSSSEEVTMQGIGETTLRRRLVEGVARLFSPIL